MLAIYGEPFRELAGTGIIRHNQNSEVKINFACVQIHNGEIFLHAWPESNCISEFMAIDTNTRINSISGMLNDGRNFMADGDILFLRCIISMPPKEKDGIVFRLSTFTTICAPDLIDESVSSVRFYLVNLRFIGTEIFQADDGSYNLCLPLDIHGRKVKIFPVVNYTYEDRLLTTRKIPRVTSFIEIPADECVEYHDDVSVVDNLCYLLTLATGSKNNWLCFSNVNSEGQIIKSDHRNPVVWKYSGLSAISPENRNGLKEFMDKSYERFLELKEKYKIHETIDAIAQAKLDDSYLELRGALVVSAIDVLRGRWAKKHKRTTIFDESAFEAKKQKLEDMVSKCAETKFTATPQQRKEVREKVSELNRPSFASILKEMCTDFEVIMSGETLKLFKENRNSLIHEGGFRKLESSVQLSSLPPDISFPEQIKEKIKYKAKEKLLVFKGIMLLNEKAVLDGLSPDREYRVAIDSLFHESHSMNINYYKDEFWRILGFADLLLLGILGYPSQPLAWINGLGKTHLFERQ